MHTIKTCFSLCSWSSLSWTKKKLFRWHSLASFINSETTQTPKLMRWTESVHLESIFFVKMKQINRFRSTRRTQEPYPLETRLEWWNDVCCEFGKWNACLLCLKSMWTISIVFKVPSIDKGQSGLVYEFGFSTLWAGGLSYQMGNKCASLRWQPISIFVLFRFENDSVIGCDSLPFCVLIK